MSYIRTRKWGFVLGIALLFAVPVVLAVWLGLIIMRPMSTLELLRAMPMYPDAYNAVYDSSEGTMPDPMDGAAAEVTYRVNELPESVFAFYEDSLPRHGWIGYNPSSIFATSLSLTKVEGLPDGFSFGGPPPWIRPKYRPVRCDVTIQALEQVRNGERYTEVTVLLITATGPVH